MNVAIIPARGGSKRIPRKNIRLFAGKPIIAYSIIAAQESGLFSKIIVSTDDEEISKVSCSLGAHVPFMRPAELADDYTSTEAVILNVLEWLLKNEQLPDFFCCIYPTAPFVSPDLIHKGLEFLKQKNACTAFPVTVFPSPIFRALQMNGAGRIEAIWPENTDKRSQELPEAYYDVGQFYWGDSKKFMKEQQLHSPDAVPIVIPRKFAHDIDTPEDWEIAEMMFQALSDKGLWRTDG